MLTRCKRYKIVDGETQSQGESRAEAGGNRMPVFFKVEPSQPLNP